MKNNKFSIAHIKPLFKVVTALGLGPPYDFNTQDYYSLSAYRYYTVFLLVLFFLCAISSFIGRIKFYYFSAKPTVMFIDVVYYLVLSITNVVFVLFLSYVHSNDLKKLLKLFSKLDHTLKWRNVSSNKLIYSMIVYHIYFIGICIGDGILWVNFLGWNIWLSYLFRYLQHYQVFNFVMFMHFMVLSLRDRFQEVNEMMKTSVFSYVYKDFMEVSNISKVKTLVYSSDLIANIRGIAKIYTNLSDVVDLFNKIFGWLLLLLTLIIIAGILQPLTVLCGYVTIDDKFGVPEFGVEMIGLCIAWGVMVLFLGITIAYSCDGATKEARYIATIAFKLLQDLPDIKVLKKNESLKEELLVLAQQASVRSLQFSAAGFFSVDFTMLYNILGSVTSYLVVIVQFNK